MTQEDIIEMANQVGCKSYSPPPTRSVAGVSMTFAQVEALIKLIAAKEREACAKVCADLMDSPELIGDCHICVEAIRART